MFPCPLSEKSEINLKSAQLLLAHAFYASSVHCSYYALFQFMTCKLSEKLNLSFEEIRHNTKGSDSHKYIINETIKCITKFKIKPGMEMVAMNVMRARIQRLKGEINDLKSYRVQSDYFNENIDCIKSEKSLKTSEKIIEDLNKLIS